MYCSQLVSLENRSGCGIIRNLRVCKYKYQYGNGVPFELPSLCMNGFLPTTPSSRACIASHVLLKTTSRFREFWLTCVQVSFAGFFLCFSKLLHLAEKRVMGYSDSRTTNTRSQDKQTQKATGKDSDSTDECRA